MGDGRQTLVMKFGGTSVGTVAAMSQVVQIVCNVNRDWERLVLVTSALSGVTDLLIGSANKAAKGDLTAFRKAEREISDRHHELIDGLVTDLAENNQAHQEVNHLLADFANLIQAIYILGEASPRALDAVSGMGERLCVRVLAGALESVGLRARFVEATQLILTDEHFQNAVPDMQATRTHTRQVLEPMLQAGVIPVVTGFIGGTPSGQLTTLGRGGSDYSASILAVALDATDVWIWTDVDGVMTADPRQVPDARTIPVISYREVAEMAYYGAKVLHPKSIHPVIAAGIGLRVCNTFNPDHPGTRVVQDKDANGIGTIKAITAIRGLKLVTVGGTGMMGVPGVAGRIFGTVANTGVNIPLIMQSTSEQTVCFAVAKENVADVTGPLQARFDEEIVRGDIDRVVASDDVGVITVVSPGLRSTPGIAGLIFTTLGNENINILGITFGTSDVSLNLILSAEDTQAAMQALHKLIPTNVIEGVFAHGHA
jgi:bifunctional aspartokinase / homoserine dehydrogenase 1